MRLINKKVLITGGARGIGYGTANLFLREGADVFIVDMREEELEKAGAQLNNQQGRCETFVCDLTEEGSLYETLDNIWEYSGGIDILFNNAGIAVREAFLDTEVSRWRQIIDVNLTAMFTVSQYISKKMKETQIAGSIINMSSKNGLAGSSMLSHYNASKGGIVLLSQSMAVELAPFNIRVNVIAPGFIDTPLDQNLKKESEEPLDLTNRTPMKRLGTIEEVANCALFLASDESSYVTGSTLVVDGGHLANASEL
ncbi:SDR family NAD(P)-dependent oxidoreductase [Alteribacillus sp. HJP-4]|uniref:SDR family NAD(P)-dependent oxidoreductase n=1 Tax=Alteribacillus sp. HJP-4 TaxID=2775394 RepID=UPI0035CD0D03